MQTTTSPWLDQLDDARNLYDIGDRRAFDVAIVGAGIAGVSTAYFLLKQTKKTVLLLDAGRVAHGATGRNAGHVVAQFERPFHDIVRAFGPAMAVQGQAALDSAWELLEEMMQDSKCTTPFYGCTGYDGYQTVEEIINELETHRLCKEHGLDREPILIRADDTLLSQIPAALQEHLIEVPQSMILAVLGTEDMHFIAAEVTRMGCMNSALFCEEMVAWMQKTYGDRFIVAEELPVTHLTLRAHDATLETHKGAVMTEKVILCTNGFENIALENTAGDAIDVSFHAAVQGVIGYMAGYVDSTPNTTAAICYFPRENEDKPYYYLTRRPYAAKTGPEETLTCLGGPERMLPDCATYDPTAAFPADIEEELDRTMQTTYRNLPATATRRYTWQGLMGYTSNMIRRVGFEPKNPVLLYNLGCNGVGLLPSIYGGKRIAQLVAGIKLPPSIFDPELGNL